MSTGKILGIVGLVVVIAGAVFFAVRGHGTSGPPERVLSQKVTLIGVENPFPIKEITIAEKQKLSLDPATGRFNIDGVLWANPAKCVSCNEMVPEVVIPPGTERPGQVMNRYVCPKCGKNAYEAQ